MKEKNVSFVCFILMFRKTSWSELRFEVSTDFDEDFFLYEANS